MQTFALVFEIFYVKSCKKKKKSPFIVKPNVFLIKQLKYMSIVSNKTNPLVNSLFVSQLYKYISVCQNDGQLHTN